MRFGIGEIRVLGRLEVVDEDDEEEAEEAGLIMEVNCNEVFELERRD